LSAQGSWRRYGRQKKKKLPGNGTARTTTSKLLRERGAPPQEAYPTTVKEKGETEAVRKKKNKAELPERSPTHGHGGVLVEHPP